jgi:hypothetical protein
MSFNLDINTYTPSELEEILGLVPPFSKQDISKKASQLIKNIDTDSSIAPDLKNNTVDFIKKVEEKLFKITDTVPSVIRVPVEQVKATDSEYRLNYAPVDLVGGDHDLIVRQGVPFSISYPGEYHTGVLNPLEKRTIRKILNIDTRFRDNYGQTNATNCSLNLPLQITVLNMILTSIEIPKSYYVISRQYGNNFFSITAGNEKIIYIVPDGNYSNQDLVDYLNNYADNNGYTSLTNPLLYYITFNVNIIGQTGSGSGQFIIGINSSYGSSLFNFTVNFNEDINGNIDNTTPIIMKLGWLLGFREGVYINNYSYVSEGIIDLYGPRYLFLAIDDYTKNVNNGFYSAFHDTFLNKNILARLSINTNTAIDKYYIQNWDGLNVLTYPRQYFGPINLFKLGIQLLNEYGVPIDLNNMDFSFCLSFECPYNI